MATVDFIHQTAGTHHETVSYSIQPLTRLDKITEALTLERTSLS